MKAEYQYLMADDYFTQNSENYTPVSFADKDIQFLINYSDPQAPIFQSKKVENNKASLVGNYCLSNSSIIIVYQIDPLFVCIKILQKMFLQPQENKVEYDTLFNREIDLQVYLSKRDDIKQNIHHICKTLQVQDDLYVQPNKELLFDFLNAKRENMNKFIVKGPFELSSCNENANAYNQQKHAAYFKDYIGKELHDLYIKTSPEFIVKLNSQQNNSQKDQFQPEKGSKQKSKSQPHQKQSEIKNSQPPKGVKQISVYFTAKPKQ